MRRGSLRWAFLVAAGTWLAAGPGGVTLMAIAACRHHATSPHDGHHANVPQGAACFCGEMTGGSDVVVQTAVPVAPADPTPASARIIAVSFSPPPALSLGLRPAPEPPPPNDLG